MVFRSLDVDCGGRGETMYFFVTKGWNVASHMQKASKQTDALDFVFALPSL
jgi:hypothetical protein